MTNYKFRKTKDTNRLKIAKQLIAEHFVDGDGTIFNALNEKMDQEKFLTLLYEEDNFKIYLNNKYNWFIVVGLSDELFSELSDFHSKKQRNFLTNKEAIDVLKSKLDGHTDTSYEWCETVRLAVNALEFQEKLSWISTEDELPLKRDWCLGIFKDDLDNETIPIVCDYTGKVTDNTTDEGWILAHITDVANTDNINEYYKKLKCVYWTNLPDKPNDK